ncbi:Uncharacterised protein [uncultured archaeon]|nr:Uncharacterised protein [uncultured archaeon]
MIETTVVTWILSKVWWSILGVLRRMGFDFAKRRFREKIKVELNSTDLDIDLITDTPVPYAWLKFKVRSASDVDLITKKIVAWVLVGGATADKIDWSAQDNILAKSLRNVNYHQIPDRLPERQTQDEVFQFYYPLPPHVDISKHVLSIDMVIEFDCIYGTISKTFQVHDNISKDKSDKWKTALDKWKQDYEGKESVWI